MPDPLDSILADKLTAGGLLSALKLARWCIQNPDYIIARPTTPIAFYRAWETTRRLIWDAVDDAADCNRSQGHADAIAESLGIVGVLERVNAIEHLRRTRSGDPQPIVEAVDGQLSGAIARLMAGLAENVAATN